MIPAALLLAALAAAGEPPKPGVLSSAQTNLPSQQPPRRRAERPLRPPEGFAAARTPYPANGFAARDMLCAAAPSPVAVLMSTEADSDNRMPKLLITVLQGKARSWRCDHDAPPPSPEPVPSPLPEAAKP